MSEFAQANAPLKPSTSREAQGNVQAAAPTGLRSLNCAASLNNGLLTLEDGTSLELADLVDFVKGVARKVVPSSNDKPHRVSRRPVGLSQTDMA